MASGLLPEIIVSDDYAGMKVWNKKFFYGAVPADDGNGEEWVFKAEFEEHYSENGRLMKRDRKVLIPFDKLGAPDADEGNCVECLMIGIWWVLTKYNLTLMR